MTSKDNIKTRIYQEPRCLLSVEEVARRLGISKQTVYNGISRAAEEPFPIPVKRFGRRPVFDSYDVERYIAELPYDTRI